MKPWIVWLIVLSALLLFAVTKVGVRIRWAEQKLSLKIRVGKIHVTLPLGKKEKKNKSASKQPKSSNDGCMAKEKKDNQNTKKWIKAFFVYWRELLSLVGRVLKTPALDLLRFHICVGGGDATACAIQYGRICAALSTVLPVIYNTFSVGKEDIYTECDYARSKLDIMAEVEITVRIYEIFALAGAALGLLFQIYRSTKTNQKAVQQI